MTVSITTFKVFKYFDVSAGQNAFRFEWDVSGIPDVDYNNIYIRCTNLSGANRIYSAYEGLNDSNKSPVTYISDTTVRGFRVFINSLLSNYNFQLTVTKNGVTGNVAASSTIAAVRGYSVIYNNQVFPGTDMTPYDSNVYNYGDVVSVKFNTQSVSMNVDTQEELVFVGWDRDATPTSTPQYSPTGTTTFTMGTSDVTLYGMYDYGIRFLAAEGTEALVSNLPDPIITGYSGPMNIIIPTQIPTVSPDAGVFRAWARFTWENSSNWFAPGSEAYTFGNIRLYTILGYGAQYDSGVPDVTDVPQSVVVSPGESFVVGSAPTRIGYIFAGWLSNESTPVLYAPGDTVTPGKYLTLTAQWVTYSVTYLPNAANVVMDISDSTEYLNGAMVNVKFVPTPTRAGYTFAGWNTQADGSGTSYSSTGTTRFNISGNSVTLHAQWTTAPPPTAVSLATPTISSAIGGDNIITVTWAAIAGASSYDIIYGPSVGSGVTTINNATSPLVVSGLVNGTQYSFMVRAIGDNTTYLSSGLSAAVDAIPSAHIGTPICFFGSAPVMTPTGWKRIDSLEVGDLVRTADGRDVAIQRVKHQRIETPSAAVNPFVIPKGQFGATENLPISPRHCVAVPGRGMVEARELGLIQMSMRAAFDYYNLELVEWDNMIVAGVEVESLAPRKCISMTVEQLTEMLKDLPAGKEADSLKRFVAFAASKSDGRVALDMTLSERRTR